MEFNYEHLSETDNPAVIFRGIVGSHAYGTANAQSDSARRDCRALFAVESGILKSTHVIRREGTV